MGSPTEHIIEFRGTESQPRTLGTLALLTIAALLLAFTFRWPLVDDAYITFRYAHNALAGANWVYNPAQYVLGTTTPLWMTAMTATGMLGFNPESASVWISVACALLLSLTAMSLLRSELSLLARGAVIAPMLLSYDTHLAIFSGMETMAYALFVVGTFRALHQHRPGGAALCGALATLCRPDGLVVLVIAASTILMTDRQGLRRFLAATAFLLLPWILFATFLYGSPLPHSVAAKQIVHAGGPAHNLGRLLELLTMTPFSGVLTIFGLSGLAFLVFVARREWSKRLTYLPAVSWCILYAAGIVFSGVEPVFFWYSTPLLIVFLIFGGLGAVEFLRLRTPLSFDQRSTIFLVSMLVLALGAPVCRSLPQPTITRSETYRTIALDLLPRMERGQTVYVAETGVLGYFLPEQEIIDSAGITSEEVFTLRKAAAAVARARVHGFPVRDETPLRWSEQVLQRFTPHWIISPRIWLNIDGLLRDPNFLAAYTLVKEYPIPGDDVAPILVFQRKAEYQIASPPPATTTPP